MRNKINNPYKINNSNKLILLFFKYYSKGKHSVILKKNNHIIKTSRNKYNNLNNISNEYRILKYLNNQKTLSIIKSLGFYRFFPSIYSYYELNNKQYIEIEFIQGNSLKQHYNTIIKKIKENIKIVKNLNNLNNNITLKNPNQELRKEISETISLLNQLIKAGFILDLLKIDKKEMRRPFTNIIVNNHKIYLIDFERSKITDRPRNIITLINSYYIKEFKDHLNLEDYPLINHLIRDPRNKEIINKYYKLLNKIRKNYLK